MLTSPPDPQGVREGVQSRAAAERRGGQQVSRLRLRRHLGHRQNPDPSDGAAPQQAAAKQVPQLHRGRPGSGENGAGRHERDQLLWRDGKSLKDAHMHNRSGENGGRGAWAYCEDTVSLTGKVLRSHRYSAGKQDGKCLLWAKRGAQPSASPLMLQRGPPCLCG